jgi:hypothetical protein
MMATMSLGSWQSWGETRSTVADLMLIWSYPGNRRARNLGERLRGLGMTDNS